VKIIILLDEQKLHSLTGSLSSLQ